MHTLLLFPLEDEGIIQMPCAYLKPNLPILTVTSKKSGYFLVICMKL